MNDLMYGSLIYTDDHEGINDDFINEIVVEDTYIEPREGEEYGAYGHQNVEVVIAEEVIDYSLLRGDILTDTEDCDGDCGQDCEEGTLQSFNNDCEDTNEAIVGDTIGIFTEPCPEESVIVDYVVGQESGHYYDPVCEITEIEDRELSENSCITSLNDSTEQDDHFAQDHEDTSTQSVESQIDTHTTYDGERDSLLELSENTGAALINNADVDEQYSLECNAQLIESQEYTHAAQEEKFDSESQFTDSVNENKTTEISTCISQQLEEGDTNDTHTNDPERDNSESGFIDSVNEDNQNTEISASEQPQEIDLIECEKVLTEDNKNVFELKSENSSLPLTVKNDAQGSHICNICSKIFSKKSYLTRHKRTHSETQKYVCDICARGFISNSILVRHKLTHGQRSFICDACGLSFGSRSGLQYHMQTHSDVKTYVRCDLCEKEFTSKSSLTQHIKVVHKKERGYLCDTCGASFQKLSALKKHSVRHIPDQSLPSFTCDICNNSYKDKYTLKVHMKLHESQKQFSCSECDKSFTYKHTLICHLRTHSGCKPYTCSYCHKNFTQSSSLKVHLAMQCNKKLSDNYDLVE